jgi:hypothetical protein
MAKEYGKFNYVDYAKSLQSQNPCLKHIVLMGDDLPEGTVSFQEMWENELEKNIPRTIWTKIAK